MAPSFSFGFSELLLASRLIEAGRSEPWTFEVVAGARDERRPFLIATGLEQVIDLLAGLAFAETDLALLRAEHGPAKVDPPLDGPALVRLASLRFRGDVFAVPEGTVVFAGEPLLRLRASAPEAVVVGAAIVATLRAQTTIASRAARLCMAAGGKPVYELGPSAIAREAALLVARAAFVGGVTATSNPLAAGAWAMPAFAVVPLSQLSAMGETGRAFAGCGVLLDGVGGDQVEAAISGAPVKPRLLLVDVARMSDAPSRVMELRTRLNAQGWSDVGIVGVGELDEARIEDLAQPDVPIDGFGVSAAQLLGDDSSAPAFDYELVEREVAGKRIALSRRDGGTGARAVWRKRESGRYRADTVQPETKAPPSGAAPLLVPMMEKGARLFRSPNLSEVRVLSESQLSMFDPAVIRRADPTRYTVNCVADHPAPAPAAKPAAPASGRPNVLEHLDDSADFTFVSNVFASVASKLSSNEDESPEESVEPVEPVEPSSPEIDEGDEEGSSEIEAPLASAAQGDAAIDDEAPDFEEVVDPPALEASDEIVLPLPPPMPPVPAPKPAATAHPAKVPDRAPGKSSSKAPDKAPSKAPVVAKVEAPAPPPAPKAAAPKAPAPAPKPAAPKAEPTSRSEPIGSESGGNNLLLVAAARLRSLQGGGSSSPKATLEMPVVQPKPAPPESKSAPVEPMETPSSGAGDRKDPLLAAAARLKSLRGGG